MKTTGPGTHGTPYSNALCVTITAVPARYPPICPPGQKTCPWQSQQRQEAPLCLDPTAHDTPFLSILPHPPQVSGPLGSNEETLSLASF